MHLPMCIFFLTCSLCCYFPLTFCWTSAISLSRIWTECIFKSVYSFHLLLKLPDIQRECESTWYLEKCIKVISLFHRHERESQNKASGSECRAAGEAGRLIRLEPSRRERTSAAPSVQTNLRHTENSDFIGTGTINDEGLTRSKKSDVRLWLCVKSRDGEYSFWDIIMREMWFVLIP